MSRALQKSAQFETDVALQFGWFARQAGERIAWRFLESVERTLSKLTRQPDLGRVRHFRHPALQGLRSSRLEPPFVKLLVFYQAGADTLQVWRLMHGARDLPRRLIEPPGV